MLRHSQLQREQPLAKRAPEAAHHAPGHLVEPLLPGGAVPTAISGRQGSCAYGKGAAEQQTPRLGQFDRSIEGR